ncbi:MAG TPA: guanylate kinase [Caldisericia bacterium]|nr:guanylate kinase [Caldisericia bacterium]HOU08348.1 guanylate kinase [Caldisericia bacterium]HPL89034.1 guanylate kinase [Caldisericia bacterium]HQG58833.1 guanylate kinase [Caldisericia bacterium]HQJ43531.1 guanylate kinase [Caldisericia bacterium]
MQSSLFVLSGPSGVGKTTIRQELARMMPELFVSVSATTRQKRPDEVDGRDYLFLGKEKFDVMLSENGFFEWANVHGNFYGTPTKPIEEKLACGKDALLVIDVQGACQVRTRMPSSAILIFLLPPSINELESRLNGRKSDSIEQVKLRLENAKSELKSLLNYDYSVVNHTIAQATHDVASIIRWCSYRRKYDRQGKN